MIARLWKRFEESYRVRRWVRWPTDVVVVLALAAGVCLVHLLVLGMPLLSSWLRMAY